MAQAEKIIELANQLKIEEGKAVGGNNSAITRARKIAQEIKKVCGEAREELQGLRAEKTA